MLDQKYLIYFLLDFLKLMKLVLFFLSSQGPSNFRLVSNFSSENSKVFFPAGKGWKTFFVE